LRRLIKPKTHFCAATQAIAISFELIS